MPFFTSFRSRLADELEILDSEEGKLIDQNSELRKSILRLRKEIRFLERQPMAAHTSQIICMYCDSSINNGALVCRYCRRPVMSNLEQYIEMEVHIQQRVAQLSKES